MSYQQPYPAPTVNGNIVSLDVNQLPKAPPAPRHPVHKHVAKLAKRHMPPRKP